MEVWVFGNLDLEEDALPVRLIQKLQGVFPQTVFRFQDPLDEWNMPYHLLIIDTVKGIDAVKTFSSLDEFADAPRVTMHDLDVMAQLKFMQKIGKLPRVTIIGVPGSLSEDDALRQVASALRECGV